MSEFDLGSNRWKLKGAHTEPAQRLIERVRQIVKMRDEGMTYPQIAAVFHCHVNTVYYSDRRWHSWAHNRQPEKTKIQPPVA